MDRRSFLRWLGIGVPAAAVAAVVAPKLTEPKVVDARLGEWNNFYSEGDPELMEAIENWKTRPADYPEPAFKNIYFDREFMQSLKADTLANFEKIASRKKIPVYMDVKRNFFVYQTKS